MIQCLLTGRLFYQAGLLSTFSPKTQDKYLIEVRTSRYHLINQNKLLFSIYMLQSAAFRMLTQSFAINAPILNYHVQYATTNQSWECYPPYNWYKG